MVLLIGSDNFRIVSDHAAKEQRFNVYSIRCNDCTQKYVEQTKRQFGTHLKEHQKTVFHFKKELFLLELKIECEPLVYDFSSKFSFYPKLYQVVKGLYTAKN